MELTTGKIFAIIAVVTIISGMLIWQFTLPSLSIYSYAKKVPIQLGYDEFQEYWVLSSVVSETERFRIVLEDNSEDTVDSEEKAVAQSEVGLLLNPLNPYSRTNIGAYDISYRTKLVPAESRRLPAYDVNDAGWLTTARYNIGVWKNGEELSSRDVEVDYQKQRVINIDTPEGQVTVNNLGILPQGVEVPSGDLVIVEDPYGIDHVFNKADVTQWINTWDTQAAGKPYGGIYSYEEFWGVSDQKGWLPNDVQLTHVSQVDIEGEYNHIKLIYSGIVFAGDITIYIPDELADTIIVQLFKPIPEIVNVDPSPLPATYEGQSADFNVKVKNVGTEGTISISCSCDIGSFTPLTETSRNMQAEETFTFKFKAHALNVLEDKDTTIHIFVQGRGGTDSYDLAWRVLDDPGHTPPAGNGGIPPSDGDEEEIDWVFWILIVAIVIIISVALIIYAYRRWS